MSDLKKIAEKFGTPVYIYETKKIKENYKKIIFSLKYPNYKIYFAVMCNNNLEVLKIIKSLGLGVQINSENELKLVKKAGFGNKNISFTSAGLSKEFIKKIISENIEINLDSVEEVEKFCSLTKKGVFGIRIKIPSQIKVYSNYSTNKALDSNVGIDINDLDKIKKLAENSKNKITGIHGYFASNVLETNLFMQFGDFITKIAETFPDLEYVNFGSGFGIPYSEAEKEIELKIIFEYYAKLLQNLSKKIGRIIIMKIEPGRLILANAGILLTKITNIKKLNSEKSEISVNSGFGEFARPRVYGAYHKIENLDSSSSTQIRIYDIRGNSVLQDDFLGKDRVLKEVKEGDLLIIRDVGAYGAVMASGFPGRNKQVKEVLI
ncbi:MAG: hypothetical protein NT076_04815 [Candidatus Pacearchaeota archaeon]|nr:hypothetical protein [Candidatus Pacearchaeota archaeon]